VRRFWLQEVMQYGIARYRSSSINDGRVKPTDRSCRLALSSRGYDWVRATKPNRCPKATFSLGAYSSCDKPSGGSSFAALTTLLHNGPSAVFCTAVGRESYSLAFVRTHCPPKLISRMGSLDSGGGRFNLGKLNERAEGAARDSVAIALRGCGELHLAFWAFDAS
jgi:hypothetical protein